MKLSEYHFTDSNNNLVIIQELADCDLEQIIKGIQYTDKYYENESFIYFVKQTIHQILKGIQFIHKNQLVHRDLKAANCLILDDKIKICDFGFAKQCASNDVLMSMKGTPIYIAPEICRGLPYNFKCDIWSFGIMCFQLATGKVPFLANDQTQLIKFLAEGDLNIDYNNYDIFNQIPSLRNLIEACLQKNPSKRPTSDQLLKHQFLSGLIPSEESLYDMNYRNWNTIEKRIYQSVFINKQVFKSIQKSQQIYTINNDINELLSVNILEQEQEQSQLLKYIIKFLQQPKDFKELIKNQDMKQVLQINEYVQQLYLSLISLNDDQLTYTKTIQFLSLILVQTQPGIIKQIFSQVKNIINIYDDKQSILYSRLLSILMGVFVTTKVPVHIIQQAQFPYDLLFSIYNPENKDQQVLNYNQLYYLLINQVLHTKEHVVLFQNSLNVVYNNLPNKTNQQNIELIKHKMILINIIQTQILNMFNLIEWKSIKYSGYSTTLKMNQITGANNFCENYDITIWKQYLDQSQKSDNISFPNYIENKYYDIQQINSHRQNIIHSDQIKQSVIIAATNALNHLPNMSITTYNFIKQTSGQDLLQDFQQKVKTVIQHLAEDLMNQTFNYTTNSDFDCEQSLQQLLQACKQSNDKEFEFDCLQSSYLQYIFNIQFILQQQNIKDVNQNQEAQNFYIQDLQFQQLLTDQRLDNLTTLEILISNAEASEIYQCDSIIDWFKPLENIIFYTINMQKLINFQYQNKNYEENKQLIENLNKEQAKQIVLLSNFILNNQIPTKFINKFQIQYFYNIYFEEQCNQVKQIILFQDKQDQYEKIQYQKDLQDAVLPVRGNIIIMDNQIIDNIAPQQQLNSIQQFKFNETLFNYKTQYNLRLYVISQQLFKIIDIQTILQQILPNNLVLIQDGELKIQYKKFNEILKNNMNFNVTKQNILYEYRLCDDQNATQETQDQILNDYLNQANDRIIYLKPLYILSQSNQLCQELIQYKLQIQNENQYFSISFVTFFILQMFIIPANTEEEEFRLDILNQLLINDDDQIILDDINSDIEVIQQNYKDMDNMDIINILINKFLCQMANIQLDFNQYQIRLQFQKAYLTLQEQQFNKNIYITGDNYGFIIPQYNVLVQEDVQFGILYKILQIVNQLSQRYNISVNSFISKESIQQIINIHECCILDNYSQHFNQQVCYFDQLIQFMEVLQDNDEQQYIEDILKFITVTQQLQFRQNVQEILQNCILKPIHINSIYETQLLCATHGCQLCKRRINNCEYQSQVSIFLNKLNSFQQSKLIYEANIQWQRLLSPQSVFILLKMYNTISEQQLQNIDMYLVIKFISIMLTEQIAKQIMLQTSQQLYENQVVIQICHFLNKYCINEKYIQKVIDQKFIQKLLHISYFIKKQKSLKLIYTTLLNIIQFQSEHDEITTCLAYEYYYAGGLQINYINNVFSDKQLKTKDSISPIVMSIISILCQQSQNIATQVTNVITNQLIQKFLRSQNVEFFESITYYVVSLLQYEHKFEDIINQYLQFISQTYYIQVDEYQIEYLQALLYFLTEAYDYNQQVNNFIETIQDDITQIFKKQEQFDYQIRILALKLMFQAKMFNQQQNRVVYDQILKLINQIQQDKQLSQILGQIILQNKIFFTKSQLLRLQRINSNIQLQDQQ